MEHPFIDIYRWFSHYKLHLSRIANCHVWLPKRMSLFYWTSFSNPLKFSKFWCWDKILEASWVVGSMFVRPKTDLLIGSFLASTPPICGTQKRERERGRDFSATLKRHFFFEGRTPCGEFAASATSQFLLTIWMDYSYNIMTSLSRHWNDG